MTTQYSIPVIHPAFELLKRSAGALHLIAASLILVNAITELRAHDVSNILCYSQLVIAADVFLLVFFGGVLLVEAPRLNLVFRFIEAPALMGIGFNLMADGFAWPGIFHLLFSFGYVFLFYREWRVLHSEAVDIRSTGITIPNFIRDAEISWNEIRSILPRYHCIIIKTFRNKTFQFQLRKNLNMEELQQIDDFCRQHLVS